MAGKCPLVMTHIGISDSALHETTQIIEDFVDLERATEEEESPSDVSDPSGPTGKRRQKLLEVNHWLCDE